METSEILARQHERLINEFIESVLAEMDLGDLVRNVMGVALRREVETELVPCLVAIQAVYHAADARVLGQDLRAWLDRVSSVMTAESAFVTEMGWRLDPSGADLGEENLGLRVGESEIGRVFEAHLWEVMPWVSGSAGSLT